MNTTVKTSEKESRSCLNLRCFSASILVFWFIWVVLGIVHNFIKVDYYNQSAYETESCDEYVECCKVTFEKNGKQTTDFFLQNMSCVVYFQSFMIHHLVFYFLLLVALFISSIGIVKGIHQLILMSVIQCGIAILIGIYGICFAVWNSSGTDLGYAGQYLVLCYLKSGN
eukprot:50303_1